MESEPINLYSDTVEPVHRSLPEEVFFICLDADPEPGSDEFGVKGGAFVNCYVDADDLRTAELRAIALIQQEGWRPYRFDRWEITCVECASDSPSSEDDDGPTARELVERALEDGGVCVFYCWPIDAPDAEERDR